MFVIPVVSYMPIELVGYSVDPGISHGTRKLVRTPWVIKKKQLSIKYVSDSILLSEIN